MLKSTFKDGLATKLQTLPIPVIQDFVLTGLCKYETVELKQGFSPNWFFHPEIVTDV